MTLNIGTELFDMPSKQFGEITKIVNSEFYIHWAGTYYHTERFTETFLKWNIELKDILIVNSPQEKLALQLKYGADNE
jgi:hypothetical protein